MSSLQPPYKQIQFSHHQTGHFVKTRLLVLGEQAEKTNDDKQNVEAWHAKYQCSGIKYCQYHHPSILTTNKTHDNVKFTDFKMNQQLLSPRIYKTQQSSSLQLKQQTEINYHSHVKNWNMRGRYPCIAPSGHPTCEEATLTLFKKHDVSIFQPMFCIPNA